MPEEVEMDTVEISPLDQPAGLGRPIDSSRVHLDLGALSHPGKEGVITSGTRDWSDYSAGSELVLELYETVGLVVRARGHRRYYAGVVGGGKASLIKRVDARVEVLAAADHSVVPNSRVKFEVSAQGEALALAIGGRPVVAARDATFSSGGVGFLIEGGTVPALGFSVKRL